MMRAATTRASAVWAMAVWSGGWWGLGSLETMTRATAFLEWPRNCCTPAACPPGWRAGDGLVSLAGVMPGPPVRATVTPELACGRDPCARGPEYFGGFTFWWALRQNVCCRSLSVLSGCTVEESLVCSGLRWRFTWWALVSPWRSCSLKLLTSLFVAARGRYTTSDGKYPSFMVPPCRWN